MPSCAAAGRKGNVMEKEKVRFFARAEGRVQGVGFRFFVQQNALDLGLCGWVRNMEDGSVTMEVQGAAEAVEALWNRIWQGNGYIRVSGLVTEARETADEQDFVIRY